MSLPTKEYTCRTCQTKYKASITYKNEVPGKTCPQGHWYPIYKLEYDLKPRDAAGKITGSLAFSDQSRIGGVLTTTPELRAHGLGNLHEQHLIALQWWVDNYDRMILQFPEGTAVHGLLAGTFKNIHTMSKRMVYGDAPATVKLPKD